MCDEEAGGLHEQVLAGWDGGGPAASSPGGLRGDLHRVVLSV